jgi:hypothetical protein
MTNEQEILNCYVKLFPKWIAFVVLAVGVFGAFFLSPTSWVFYFWIGICLLFIIKTLTQKKEKNPVVSIGEKGIQLSNDRFYPYTEIIKVMAFSKKKLQFRTISFKLYLKNGSQIEFSVDNLDVKPQKMLDAINVKINKA